ncbi:hypothetical protein MTBMA_c15250 [Methanothermobacter marburgensis str. Marburg]|uniref:Uncharacterized protein n=1 Tax=Methanothermobacter marburgensis (strain ATCC BAA-927 / DSM 2133 / JCM 14651 / NBRC 100331 / OCM 82 / Marburg) TaxID=79929 RepID=D9PY06_METTM|nr:hypothetical protein MTBMA_c15250 [Methanothermobacter marburgensis str. Marburg]
MTCKLRINIWGHGNMFIINIYFLLLMLFQRGIQQNEETAHHFNPEGVSLIF